MRKVIVIKDMHKLPSTCIECPVAPFIDRKDNVLCGIDIGVRISGAVVEQTRPDNCPLVEIDI